MKTINFWAKLALMMALVVGVCSCSKDDDVQLPDGKEEIVGEWNITGDTDSFKLNSDGTAAWIYSDGSYDGGTYSISGDILTVEYTYYVEDGEKEDEEYSEFYYIVSLTSTNMVLATIAYEEDGEYEDAGDGSATTKEEIMKTTVTDVASYDAWRLKTLTKK